MRKHGYAHRDADSENIIYDKDMKKLILIDFARVIHIDDVLKPDEKELLKSLCLDWYNDYLFVFEIIFPTYMIIQNMDANYKRLLEFPELIKQIRSEFANTAFPDSITCSDYNIMIFYLIFYSHEFGLMLWGHPIETLPSNPLSNLNNLVHLFDLCFKANPTAIRKFLKPFIIDNNDIHNYNDAK